MCGTSYMRAMICVYSFSANTGPQRSAGNCDGPPVEFRSIALCLVVLRAQAFFIERFDAACTACGDDGRESTGNGHPEKTGNFDLRVSAIHLPHGGCRRGKATKSAYPSAVDCPLKLLGSLA